MNQGQMCLDILDKGKRKSEKMAGNETGIDTRVDKIDFEAFDLAKAGRRALASPQGVFFVVPVDSGRVGDCMTCKSRRTTLLIDGTEMFFKDDRYRHRYSFIDKQTAREAARYFGEHLGKEVTVFSKPSGYLS